MYVYFISYLQLTYPISELTGCCAECKPLDPLRAWLVNDKSETGSVSALPDFLAVLKGDGCDSGVIEKVLERIRVERAVVAAETARIFYRGSASKPISGLQLVDLLRELRCQALTLQLAILGACNETKIGDCGEALARQAAELFKGIERFEKAFTAEQQILGKEED